MKKKQIIENFQILINNFNAKNYKFVISKALGYLKKFPENVILYNLLGSSYQNTNEYEKAKNIFITGLKIEPNNLAIKNNLANTYKNLLRYKDAENIFNDLIISNPKYVNAYVNLGNLKRDLNKFDEALELYEKANKITPNNFIILYSLASANQGLGNFETAIKYAKEALKNNQKLTQAHFLISQSLTYKDKNWHYEEISEKIKDPNLKQDEKIDLYFSLSKAYEDLNEIDKSFHFLKIGNDLNKKKINYNINEDLDLIQKTKKNFENINFEKYQKKDQDKIIFILGMPRSGTSLVEQIISSHSQVIGGGELPILPKIIKNNFMSSQKIDAEKFNEIINDPLKIELINRNYKDFIKYFNIKNKFITDKAPLNFRWIGFIKVLFPNAKIIHCQRDPKNNCLSLYKNLFEGGLGFSYDENDLVKFYKTYKNLMSFWKAKKHNDILEISYEELVKDNREQIKRILKYCELEWEENCLNFYNNKNPIKTMSTAQARKPIYKSSLSAYEKYKDYLKIIENNL